MNHPKSQKTIDPRPLTNPDAERAVLGRILVDSSYLHDATSRLTPESFAVSPNPAIFEACIKLNAKGVNHSPSMLIGQIGERSGLEQSQLSMLLDTYIINAKRPEIAAAPFLEVVEAVGHAETRRKMVKAADVIREQALSAPLTASLDELRADAHRLLDEDGYFHNTAKKIDDIVGDLLNEASASVRAGKKNGLSTGLSTFDHLVGPMMPGQLIIIGGETSSGKTALAAQLGYLVAKQGINVRFFSLEMTKEEVAVRFVSRLSGIETERLLSADLTEKDLGGVMSAGETMIGLQLEIDDQPRVPVGVIQSRLSVSQKTNKTGLAIIDHLQYVKADTARADEREQIRQVVDDIKAMAKRLGLPVILVSHISRPAEYRQINCAADIRYPTLNSLYGSSAIEKAADAVVFVHRNEWYLRRATPRPDFASQCAADLLMWRGKAELVLAKRRNGPGHDKLQCLFDEKATWFIDPAYMSVSDPSIEL